MNSTRQSNGQDCDVALVREFNRFYTKQVGALQDGLLSSPYSLTEVRLMYELSQRKGCTASELASVLAINHGYLSRILRRFQSLGFVEKTRSSNDGRQQLLTFTSKGHHAYAPLNAAASSEVQDWLKNLSSDEVRSLLASMDTIRNLIGHDSASKTYVLRPPQPGDYGWVIAAHGDIYAREYGWNEEIEGLAAEIVGKFVENSDSKRERCWIAESQGMPVGCVFITKQSQSVAKLRLLLVTRRARGMGIGSRLIDECVRFAKQAGYRKLALWTQSNLLDARKLYKKAGFTLVRQHAHHRFGKDLVAEHWEMRL
jgi:DNA-binding MarR family transcriptional regulator/N-acetylglutamate synthase-like GNAT family acetyltransferase